MNNITPGVNPEKKRLVLNLLAIAGFLAVIIIIAWLSVQVVRVLPNAFASLASLAESLYGHNNVNELVVERNKETVVSGDEVKLHWAPAENIGTYTFAYKCTDGVAIKVRIDGTDRDARCNTTYSLGTSTETTLVVDSEQDNEVAIPFTVAFLRTNDTKPHLQSKDATLIVTNSLTNTTPTATSKDTDTVVTPAPSNPSTPATTPTHSTPTATTHVQTFSYTPVSDPRGSSDLAVRYLDAGTMIGTVLVPRPHLSVNTTGFIRFEVRNHGTKTSDVWAYTATLPDGTQYTASAQHPLKPNERAVFTLTFPVGSTAGSAPVAVVVTTKSDTAPINNRFSTVVPIIR